MSMQNFVYYADGGGSFWNTISESNPVYETVANARDLLRGGVDVPLPDGYTEDVLTNIAWDAGHFDRPIRLDARQLREIKQIARTLWSHYREQVPEGDMDVIVQLLRGKPANEDVNDTRRHPRT